MTSVFQPLSCHTDVICRTFTFRLKSYQLHTFQDHFNLTISHLQMHFDEIEANDFWKHCCQRRNCSWWPQCFQLYRDFSGFCHDVFKVVYCCMWERVKIIILSIQPYFAVCPPFILIYIHKKAEAMSLHLKPNGG